MIVPPLSYSGHDQQGAVTFVAEREPRRFGIVVTALYGVNVVWPLVFGRYLQKSYYLPPRWDTHVPKTALAAVLASLEPDYNRPPGTRPYAGTKASRRCGNRHREAHG